GQRETQLGRHDMDDAVVGGFGLEEMEAVPLGAATQVRDEVVVAALACGQHAGGRNRVIRRGEGQLRVADLQSTTLQVDEAPRTQIVDQVSIDVDQLETLAELRDYVFVPDLLKERPGLHRSLRACRC